MSDETTYSAMNEATRDQHREWHRINMEALRASGLAWRVTNRGECLLFRAPHISADFYPSTGRWRCGGKTSSGGAAKFVVWYLAQTPGPAF